MIKMQICSFSWHLFTIGLLLLFLGLLKLQSYQSYYPPFTPDTLWLSLLKDLNEENLPNNITCRYFLRCALGNILQLLSETDIFLVSHAVFSSHHHHHTVHLAKCNYLVCESCIGVKHCEDTGVSCTAQYLNFKYKQKMSSEKLCV